MFSNTSKYADWMVDKNGNYITLEEANKMNLSDAQIELLEYAQEINKRFKDQMENTPLGYDENRAIRMDATVKEVWKNEGAIAGISTWLGSDFATDQVRINFKNPITGETNPTSYSDIKNVLIDYAKKGVKEKAHAFTLMFKYNFRAKRQLKKGVNIDESVNPLNVKAKESGEFYIDDNGKMISKSGKPLSAGRTNSQDYFNAIFKFIDEMTHIKHMEPIVPYIEAVEHLNNVTDNGREKKPNIIKFLKHWKEFKIIKKQQQGAFGPELDTFLKFIRLLTSQVVMAFNYRAGVMNLLVGHYNVWRAEGAKLWVKGQNRMMIKTGARDKENGYAFNKYAMDILRKYNGISTDYDHNPQVTIGKVFDGLANWITKKGEVSIQGSMILGLMTDAEYDSFDYDTNGELKVKAGINEKELEKNMIAYKNRVSDIQGKYAEKDRRNFMNFELGKFFGQFRVWIPDWWKERFGKKYISYTNEVKEGSARTTWNKLFGQGMKEFKEQLLSKDFWKDKNTLKNLRGMAAIALLLCLKNANDDDDKKRKQSDILHKSLGDLLFIFDPHQLEFMLTTPAAGIKTITNFVKIFEHTYNMEHGFLEEYKSDNKYGDKGDFKVNDDLMRTLPWNKLYNNSVVLPEN